MTVRNLLLLGDHLSSLPRLDDGAFVSLVHENIFPPQPAQAHSRARSQGQRRCDGHDDDAVPALLYHPGMLQVVEEICQPKQGTAETEQLVILDEVAQDVRPFMLRGVEWGMNIMRGE